MILHIRTSFTRHGEDYSACGKQLFNVLCGLSQFLARTLHILIKKHVLQTGQELERCGSFRELLGKSNK